MSYATADLCDDYIGQLQVAEPIFKSYGNKTRFMGPVKTLKVFEDNQQVRDLLASPGEGRVLVVDGGGSLRCALVGGNLGVLGVKNGWAGIVVYGCIRDAVEINQQEIGVKALNTNPTKSIKRGVGEEDLVLNFAGITIEPGCYLYSDEDGLCVSAEKISL
jgi:regulator of ribonuclease activity A